MNLKPLNDTLTIAVPTLQIKTLRAAPRSVATKDAVVPSSVSHILRGERWRLMVVLALSAAALAATMILVLLYVFVYDARWSTYLVPGAVSAVALWRLIDGSLQLYAFNRAARRYEEDLKLGITSTPPFLVKLYLRLHKRQVTHNGITTFILFYGGILTVLLGFLKDVHWGIFAFDDGIKALFANPLLMSWIFTATLLAVVVVHLAFVIVRRKRIFDMDIYFGEQLIVASELETMRLAHNKFWRRCFILSVLTILVLPILIKQSLQWRRLLTCHPLLAYYSG